MQILQHTCDSYKAVSSLPASFFLPFLSILNLVRLEKWSLVTFPEYSGKFKVLDFRDKRVQPIAALTPNLKRNDKQNLDIFHEMVAAPGPIM